MKRRSQALSSRSSVSRAHPKLLTFLVLAGWACTAALLRWDAPWLYLLLGIVVIAGMRTGPRRPSLPGVLLLLALVFPAWKQVQHWSRHHVAPTQASLGGAGTSDAANRSDARVTNRDANVISALVTAEETYLTLAPKMSLLSKGLLDLRLPGPGAGGVFAPSAAVSDIGPHPAPIPTAADPFESHPWPMAEGAKEVSTVDLWRPLLDAVSWFDHAKVYIIDGEHPAGDALRYEARGGFDALARMKSGEWRSVHGKMRLTWRQTTGPDGAPEPEPGWRITRWETQELHSTASPKRFFADALDAALPAAADRQKAHRSLHYEATLKYYREDMKSPPHPYFAPISANQKEGVAVADIDGDGFDDIYVTVRIGKNMLFHNNGNGTFTEQAASVGLDLPGHTTCAVFADFDNDGDLDAMLGRSLLKTTYLENRGGKFYQHPIPKHFPMAVISMSAADYNGDGLLDVYLCTYRPAAPAGASPAGGVAQVEEGAFDWPDEFFQPDLAKEYKRRIAEHRLRTGASVLDQLGPPNVLLVNRGEGRFEPAPENTAVGLWRNSLQATWCDYNQDGRPDLYVANDWAPDNLLRNDGPAGFTDVTEESGVTSYGFAMGASWGDYDNDGREDLYVSNMYSKAGRRITAKLPELNKRFTDSAAGNWLYRQVGNGKFQQVAGLEPPAMTVMKAGWSWGGSFADFDNDGFLDLYVLSGYFTAPKELASELDL